MQNHEMVKILTIHEANKEKRNEKTKNRERKHKQSKEDKLRYDKLNDKHLLSHNKHRSLKPTRVQ
jgi:hypothetical protein